MNLICSALSFAFALGCMGSARAAVVVSADATQNITCSGGLCEPTATNAVLNVNDLETLLASGNIRIATLGAGVQAKDIHVTAAFSWSTSNTLSLDAFRSIDIDAPVSASGSTPGLNLTTNDGGSGGVLIFGKKGHVTFAEFPATIAINGATYALVNSLEALVQNISQNPAGNYAIGASVDAGRNAAYSESPIKKFRGQLEGMGNTIENLTIDARSAKRGIGLISNSSGSISNLRLTGTIQVRRGSGAVGGLIATNSGSVFNTDASVTIDAGSYTEAGGLIGQSAGGSIQFSSAEGSVNCGKYSSYCGGLVGRNSTPISNSHAAVSVSGIGTYFGGLAGWNGDGIVIENSYATGSVVSGGGGGLVGFNGGSVANSFATGTVTDGGAGASFIGGIVGDNASLGSISNSYAIGGTSAYSGNIGGFAGQNDGSIVSSYSTGSVQGTGDGLSLGGFVGDDTTSGGISNSYWDTSTSGVTNLSQGAGNVANDPGITGLTTEQFQSGLPAGFDPRTWAENQNVNSGLPYLLANPPPK